MTPIKIVCLCYLAAILVILRRQKGANYSFSTSSLVEVRGPSRLPCLYLPRSSLVSVVTPRSTLSLSKGGRNLQPSHIGVFLKKSYMQSFFFPEFWFLLSLSFYFLCTDLEWICHMHLLGCTTCATLPGQDLFDQRSRVLFKFLWWI